MARPHILKACAACAQPFAAPSGSAKFCSDRCHLLSVAVRQGECLICTVGLDKDGYGSLKLSGGRRRKAHRASYEEFVGPVPDGMMVCHSCDTPACMEPSHLFLGTALINKADCVEKGRHVRGTRLFWKNKLSEEEARAIISDPRGRRTIAHEYGVTPENIDAIRKRRTWKHLTA